MNNPGMEKRNERYVRIDVLLDKEKTKIYRVKDTESNDLCVMKIRKGRDLTRIYRQIKEIHHPNLPEIYEVVYDDCNTVIIEEYIAGEGLDLRIGRQVLSEEETVPIMLQLCDAMSAIHAQNPIIIHRDIKASNVIVKTDGTIKLIDFDAARHYDESQERDTQQMGTLEYASPEHFGYAQTDQKSDIYSAGVLMHEMLTGQTFSQEIICYKGSLKKIIRKCTRVQANKRYHSALQLKRRLEGYRYHKRRRFAVTLLITVLFVLVIGYAVHSYRQGGWRQTSEIPVEKTEEQLEKEAFQKMFGIHKKNALEQGDDKALTNIRELLECDYIYNQLDNVLGNDHSLFINNFDTITCNFNEKENFFFISGHRPQVSVNRRNNYNSAIVIRENGTVQCAYTTSDLTDEPYLLFLTNDEKEYHNLSWRMMAWFLIFYMEGYEQLVSENDLQTFPLIRLTDEAGIDPVGDYILQPAGEGLSGTIHISRRKKKDSTDYKVEGSINYKGEEHKIDLRMDNNIAVVDKSEAGRDMMLGVFYDSIILLEYMNDIDNEDGILDADGSMIAGQFIKES